MLAFSSCPTTMTTTQEENYPLYAFSGLSPHTSTYPSVYFQMQQSVSGFGAYNVQQNQTSNMSSNYTFEPHNSSKYTKQNPQLSTPLYSPTDSALNYFDIQPTGRSAKSESAASFLSSTKGSPLLSLGPSSEWTPLHGTVHQGHFQQQIFAQDNFNYEALSLPQKPGCVDPTLIQPLSPTQQMTQPYSDSKHLFPHPPSPTPSTAPSNRSQSTSGVLRTNSLRANRPASPYLPSQSWNPYPQASSSRRQSVSSVRSHHSCQSQSSLDSDENKGICPIASCGRHIKDLKAHLLTHKNERPEKCPISSCEYHIKGFARKYDKNRHTLTHYKGTMVCGFCPGSGSSSEKSFNRADVFKRHLTSVHGVEQTAPNSRRRSGNSGNKNLYNKIGASGMCSTCNVAFANVQDFYEHLDDCVLRVIQQGDPCEAINERILSSMIEDKSTKDTLERHSLSTGLGLSPPVTVDDDDDNEDDDEEDKEVKGEFVSPTSVVGNITNGDRYGMTYSKGGVPLHSNVKSNKRRKNYPPAWNAPPEKTKMKKRVLCVFDGQRRLWKDDMMLGLDHQVREPLSGRHWVTSLDVQTLRRAEGILEATDEEKGPWESPFLFPSPNLSA